MNVKYIFLVILLLIAQSLMGQELLWESTTNSGNPNDVVMDGNGNVYVTGCSMVVQTPYIRTIRYNAVTGDVAWDATWTDHPGYVDAICVDDSANVYVAGCIKVDSYPNVLQYLMVMKYDSSGFERWHNNDYLQATTEGRWHIAVDTFGGVYVASDSFDKCLLVKFDADNGARVWAHTTVLDSNDGTWRGIVIDDSGYVCVAGTEQEGENPEHLWAAKYTPDGDQVWLVEYAPTTPSGSTAQAGADGIDVDNMGNVYVGGTSDSIGGGRGLILKYNRNGDLQWTRHLKTEYTSGCRDIKVCPTSGMSYITGNTGLSARYLYVHAVDVDGCSLWVSTYGSGGDNGGCELAVTEECVYVGGHCNSGHTLVLCYRRENGILQWAEVPGIGVCYDIAVHRTDGGDSYIAPTHYFQGWKTYKYYYCETIDSMALAYNGNRHLVRTPNSEELHLVYTRGGEVVYRRSSDGGTKWNLPEVIGDGEFPAIALDVWNLPSVAWTDAEGGLWYRRKISSSDWTDAYHLDNPGGSNDPHLNSPPAITIDPFEPGTVHILVTRSGMMPEYKYQYAHTVEDFSFPINDTSQGRFEIIEEKHGPLEPPLVTFPSIARCEPNNSLHASWQRQDTICYASKPRDCPWANWGPQFGIDGLQSSHPFVETYGDSVFVVWQNEAAEEIYRGANWIYNLPPEFLWVAFTQTANLSSLYPVNASGLFTLYAEEPTTNNPYDIYYKIRPYDDRINISNTPQNSCYPQSAARFAIGGDYHYTAWLEGDAAPYQIKFKRIQHLDPPDKAYLSATMGQSSPSPYLVVRDSFIDSWQIPVDVGNTGASYRFPLLPGYAYKAKAVVYHEASGPWTARVKIDNNLQFSVTYDANMPETLECWIPPALYEDSVLSISFNRIAGDFVAIGSILIYRYEVDAGEVGGGGPMSQDGSSIGRPKVTAFPNPFTERLNIAYELCGQHNISLKVYDVTGRMVKQFDLLANETFVQVVWDGDDDRGRAVPQGVYFLWLDNPDMDDIICRKVLRVK